MKFDIKDIERKPEDAMEKLRGDKAIWFIIILLSLVSILLIYSASSALAFREHTTNSAYLWKQVKFVLLGWLSVYICYKIPLRWYRRFAPILLGLSVILLAITPFMGVEVNGARRWLRIWSITFQPTEIAKITIVLYLARVLEAFKLETFKEFFFRVVVPVGVVFLLILVGSVSQALLVALVSLVMLIVGGVRWRFINYTIGIAFGAIVVAVLLHFAFGLFPRVDTAVSRLKKYAAPTEQVVPQTLTAEQKQKIADETLQADMANIAISSVGIIGKGPGKSTQRYVLPHPYSDYIYAIIVEEYGSAVGVIVLFMYIWFFSRCIVLVRRCKTVFAGLMVSGAGFLIMIQALLHILVNVGLLPVTGHTLPLVSLGGTSLVIMSCAFGIILSVGRAKSVSVETKNVSVETNNDNYNGNEIKSDN